MCMVSGSQHSVLFNCCQWLVGHAATHDLLSSVVSKAPYGSGGIRTHASEETGALNQRLRPLGHATGVASDFGALEAVSQDWISC